MCPESVYLHMSSPYPSRVNGSREKSIYALKQASIWLSRIDSNHTTVDIGEVSSQLDADRDNILESHYESVLDTAIDNYVFNHEEQVVTLFESESLSEKVEILNEIKRYISDEFGEYAPSIPDYDELSELVHEKAVEVSTHIEEYQHLSESPPTV